MVALEDADDVEGEVSGVGPGEAGAALDQLGLDEGQLLEECRAPLEEVLDVEGLARQVEQEGDMLGDGQVDGATATGCGVVVIYLEMVLMMMIVDRLALMVEALKVCDTSRF